VARSQVAQRLPGAPAEACVRGQGDRHVEVENALREALIGVGRRVEEDQRQRGAEDSRRQGRQLHGGIVVGSRQVSATTYSNVAQLSTAKIASYSTRNQR